MNSIMGFTFTVTSFSTEYLLVFSALVLLYFFSAGSISLFYSVFKKLQIGQLIEARPLKNLQIRNEITWGIVTCSIVAMYLYLAFMFIERIYPENFNSAFLNILGFIVVYDFYMYVAHRLLHVKWFSKFHVGHHQSVSATPWSCISLHPVEALINYLPFLLFAYFFPVSLSVFLGIYVYLIFGIANGHSNYNLFPDASRIPLLQELTCFHQFHHSSGRANFGYLFTHWDRVFGTRHKKHEIA